MDIDHAANAGILRYLGAPGRIADSSSVARGVASSPPAGVADPYYRLGTHPDLVGRLWDEITAMLPEDCRWVVHGTPALVHPETGVIFGFGGGTHTYALRLPEAEREEALHAGAGRTHRYMDGSVLDLSGFGPEWVLLKWYRDEDRWCLAAYRAAGEAGREPGRKRRGRRRAR
jgi:hypothetical protein